MLQYITIQYQIQDMSHLTDFEYSLHSDLILNFLFVTKN